MADDSTADQDLKWEPAPPPPAGGGSRRRGWWFLAAAVVAVGWWFSSWGPGNFPAGPSCRDLTRWTAADLRSKDEGYFVVGVREIRPSDAGWGERVCAAELSPLASSDGFDFDWPNKQGAMCSNWRGSQVYQFGGVLAVADPVEECLDRLRGRR